jgi:hypothetical protein
LAGGGFVEESLFGNQNCFSPPRWAGAQMTQRTLIERTLANGRLVLAEERCCMERLLHVSRLAAVVKKGIAPGCANSGGERRHLLKTEWRGQKKVNATCPERDGSFVVWMNLESSTTNQIQIL